ncbi:hypothetical protein NE237_013378 [Protea cynaroides]|uniref:Uncharacterized protein n=1 Tax=Protea cynaroides TaxID=273540 RepID=A0A9Q0GZT3_9MAGN|nr:hypothetical protein NE237_013378 [Protea cynaroides]
MSINSVTTGETLNKRPLENGHANGDSLKYKRRNVVVKRDFPKGYGRFAERINRFSKVGDGSTKDETIVPFERESHTLKTSTTETANCLETSDQVEELKPVKAVEHETSTRIPHARITRLRPLKTSDQMKGLEMVKPLEYETSTHISQQSLVSQI